MDCKFPPPLTEDQISAFLDGEADPGVAQHVQQCPACAARLNEARKVEQMLAKSLSRWNCPASQTLGDYHLKLLDEADRLAIEHHVRRCAACQAELEELRTFLGTEPFSGQMPKPQPAPGVQPRRNRLIDLLVPRMPLPALRGDSGPAMAEGEAATLFWEVQIDADRPELVGQVVAEAQSIWDGALFELRQADKVQAVATLNELGEFRCSPVAAGPAEIRVTSASGSQLVLKDIELVID